MNDPVYSHVPRSLVDQVYCVYFSVTSNAMTTCPAAPIFSLELRLGPAGLCQLQVYCGSGQPEEGPIVGAFPVIVKLSESSFPALVSNVAVIKVLKWKS